MTETSLDPLARPDRTGPWSPVIFDLDGTLTDSQPGIVAGLRHTYRALGRPEPDEAELINRIGPPLHEGFRDLDGMDPQTVLRAVDSYRDFYDRIGWSMNTPYPGVEEVLAGLHERGVPLAIATSKPLRFAQRILDHADLARYFSVISGASMDGSRETKSEVLTTALVGLRERGEVSERATPVLVGDRSHDVIGAKACGIDSIAVGWGYGSPAEQQAATAQARTVADLAHLLGTIG